MGLTWAGAGQDGVLSGLWPAAGIQPLNGPLWVLGCEVVLTGEGQGPHSRIVSGRGFGLAVSKLSEHCGCPVPT